MTREYVSVVFTGIIFVFLYNFFSYLLRAMGNSVVPLISLILTVVSLGTRVILSYVFAPHTTFGVVAIWLSIPIGWILADAVGYIFYRKIKD